MSRFKDLFISDEELSKLEAAKQIATFKIFLPKISISKILLGIIILGFFFNQFLILRMDSSGTLKPFSISINITKKNAK